MSIEMLPSARVTAIPASAARGARAAATNNAANTAAPRAAVATLRRSRGFIRSSRFVR
jgi:hypothetical protein